MDALQNFFFWTWKIGNSTVLGTSSSPLWHYQLGLERGWIPKGAFALPPNKNIWLMSHDVRARRSPGGDRALRLCFGLVTDFRWDAPGVRYWREFLDFFALSFTTFGNFPFWVIFRFRRARRASMRRRRRCTRSRRRRCRRPTRVRRWACCRHTLRRGKSRPFLRLRLLRPRRRLLGMVGIIVRTLRSPTCGCLDCN